ncbi:MAG: Gfo/Idh/MocA family oxidoreductase [Hyphomonadaceae bacterium]|nr:Gfo/Idh/MocA family oxidoreductase [Hyphomonadaceae bacterium]
MIGCGQFGRRHAEAWLRVPDIDLVAVCDSVPERAEAAALRTRARAVAGIADMARDVDGVSIAVAPDAHARIARQCLAAGLHVLLEKPFGVSAETARRLTRLAHARGLILQAGYVEHFHPTYRRAVDRLQGPRFMTAVRVTHPPNDASGCDVVCDLMCHDIEHVLEIGGGVVSASAVALGLEASTPLATRAVLSSANGLVSVLEARYAHAHRERGLCITDAAGCVSADLLTGRLCRDGQCQNAPTEGALANQFRAFAHSIVTRGPPAVTGTRAADVLEIAQMIIASRDRAGGASEAVA